ncbi:MAG: hypothetical protein N2746_00185 [Deltaproteobacteria bacterium]|nr:hypothetical protein [Deltaproteobacteria bacterium]
MKGRVLLMFLLVSSTPYAQEIEGAKQLSMSSAFSAAANTNEALFINAAGMSLYPNRYNIDLFYTYKNRDGFNIGTLSILDSSTSYPLCAGFAFSYMWGKDVDVERQGYRIDLGFSYPFSTRLLWGFDVKYLRIDIDKKANAINAATTDTGFIFLVTKWARVSVFGQNLIYIGRDEFPMRSGAGVMIGSESSFFATEDTIFTFFKDGEKKVTQSIGANLFLGDFFSLSAGYKYDQIPKNHHYVSAGFGFFSKVAALESGFRQAIEEQDDFVITVSIKFFTE